MKKSKGILMLLCFVSFFFLVAAMNPTLGMAAAPAKKAPAGPAIADLTAYPIKAKYDGTKLPDMSDFNPYDFPNPTGDTIKIAVVATFSGPASLVGQGFWLNATWAAHEINKKGGIFVDGKKKLIELFKADTMSRPDQAKKICEQMVLQNGVKFLWGADGSPVVKVMYATASKYKVIAVNMISLSEDLQDADNWTPYVFSTWWQTNMVGKSFAYFYSQRKKEKKFYCLNQDYLYGHQMADSFKAGLKEFYPEAQVVGEDYHKMFNTDFAPYITKIKASGAEVVFTGNWSVDADNLLKQARALGLNIPFAHIYMGNPTNLEEVGIKGSAGLVISSPYRADAPLFKEPGYIKYFNAMLDAAKKFDKPPFNAPNYLLGWDPITMEFNWLCSVIERAKSTDADKIIKVWEGDVYQYVNGHVVAMRACDHQAIQALHVIEYVPPDQQKVMYNIPPYHFGDGKYSFDGPSFKVPEDKVLPWMDPKLKRCQGKKPADIN
jgi:ABC-type branched-subunit amino acid transport system substrate-binding protein